MTSDGLGFVGGEKHGSLSNLLRIYRPLHWNDSHEQLAHRRILQFLPGQWRLHQPRCNADDTDAAAAEFQGAAARDHVNTSLGSTIGCLALSRLLRIHRRDVDDNSSISLL